MTTANAMISARVPLEVKEAAGRGLERAGITLSQLINLTMQYVARNEQDAQSIQDLLDVMEGKQVARDEERVQRAEAMRAMVMTPERFEELFGVKPAACGCSDEELELMKEQHMFERYLKE